MSGERVGKPDCLISILLAVTSHIARVIPATNLDASTAGGENVPRRNAAEIPAARTVKRSASAGGRGPGPAGAPGVLLELAEDPRQEAQDEGKE
jgi:hypothetical protein